MKLNYFSLFIQLLIGFGLYSLFDYYNITRFFTIALLVVVVIIVVFNVLKAKNREMYLEVLCNPTVYLEKLEPLQYRSNVVNEYQLSLAYAYIYKGEYDLAQTHVEQVVFEDIKDKDKYFPIYIRVQAKIAYEQQNEQVIQDIILKLEQEESHEMLITYCKILLVLLQEQYEETIKLLVEFIPTQVKRVLLIELEYYLGFAYTMTNQLDDAKAVLAFVVKKGFHVVYTDLAYEMHRKLEE